MDDAQPYLISTAKKHLEGELKRPRITTRQSLLLLSQVYCAIGQDTKGWLVTGDACMLAIDLGIHKNVTSQTTSAPLSPEDKRIRQLTFWGCIISTDVGPCTWADRSASKQKISSNSVSPRQTKEIPGRRIAYAWVTLVKIVGDVCEALNSGDCTFTNSRRLTNSSEPGTQISTLPYTITQTR